MSQLNRRAVAADGGDEESRLVRTESHRLLVPEGGRKVGAPQQLWLACTCTSGAHVVRDGFPVCTEEQQLLRRRLQKQHPLRRADSFDNPIQVASLRVK